MKIELLLANLCNLSYKQKTLDFKSIDIKPQFYEYFDCKHVEAYLINFTYFNVLVFRGTDTIKDWEYNLKLKPIKTEWGLVHSGFYNSFHLIWADYLSDPNTLSLLKARPLYITGHSLGGCLAILLGLQLKQLKDFEVFPMSIYTYGSPKALEPNNDLDLDLNIYNYVLKGDIIPSLPLFNYRHIGKVIKLNNKTNWFNTLVNYSKYFIKLNISNLLKSHQIESYVKALSVERDSKSSSNR